MDCKCQTTKIRLMNGTNSDILNGKIFFDYVAL